MSWMLASSDGHQHGPDRHILRGWVTLGGQVKRVPIELIHKTAYVSERIIASFSSAVDAIDKAYRSDPQKIAVETAHEVLVSGVETIDDAEWRSWSPKQREQFLINLLGGIDAVLMLIILQQSGLSPGEVTAAAEEDFATLH